MPKALWRQMLEASRGEALLAVDLYNRPAQHRHLEAFYVHMHLAWLYLLHARFRRDGVDYRYRSSDGSYELVDGEPKTWDLATCVKRRWSSGNDPVRTNLEFTIQLRNKIEHRHQDAIAVVTAGHAQACVLNYEVELLDTFGQRWSLGESLRFPLIVSTFTQQGVSDLTALQKKLPKGVRTFIADFTAGLDRAVAEDDSFELRLNLIPKRTSATDADLALTFVRLEDLDKADRDTVKRLGTVGKAVVVTKDRPVHNLGRLRPCDVVEQVAAAIPFEFKMHHFVAAWKRLTVRPLKGAGDPFKTDRRYCVYDPVHRDYVYTPAFAERLIRRCGAEGDFVDVTGFPARRKSSAKRPAA